MGSKRIAIVANPFSGRRDNRPVIEALGRELSSLHFEPVFFWNLAAWQAAEIDSDWIAQVAAGGDGTLMQVLEKRLDLPLAVFPLGNENLFARHWKHRAHPAELARLIAAGREKRVDLGEVNGRLFSCVVSAGFDAEVSRRLAQWRQQPGLLRRVGRRSYLRPMLSTFFNYPFPKIRIETESETLTGAMALVFNLPEYAFGLPLAPQACGDDGWLDWLVFENPGRLSLLRQSLLTHLGKHLGKPGVRHGRCRFIRILPDSGSSPAPIQIDGEAAGHLPMQITVKPAAVRIFI